MSIPSWARVGAKVVCVDTSAHAEWQSPGLPVRTNSTRMLVAGAVYTIRAAGVDRAHNVPCLWLEEVIRDIGPHGAEVGFKIARFRPLVTLEDDMEAHFRALLDAPAPTERERA